MPKLSKRDLSVLRAMEAFAAARDRAGYEAAKLLVAKLPVLYQFAMVDHARAADARIRLGQRNATMDRIEQMGIA